MDIVSTNCPNVALHGAVKIVKSYMEKVGVDFGHELLEDLLSNWHDPLWVVDQRLVERLVIAYEVVRVNKEARGALKLHFLDTIPILGQCHIGVRVKKVPKSPNQRIKVNAHVHFSLLVVSCRSIPFSVSLNKCSC